MEGLYYEHSGKFSVTGMLYSIVVGSLIACFCAFLYAYIILYCPLVYINLLITCGFAALVGYSSAALLKRKKVRSDKVAVAISFLVITVAYHYHWVSWVWALMRRADSSAAPFEAFVSLWLMPNILWQTIGEINLIGAWSLRGSDPVTGTPLLIVWLVEAGIIYGLALYVGYKAMDEEPFCETCEEWGKKKENVVEAAITDLPTFKQRMEAKDFKFLEAAGAPKAETMEFQRIDLFSCERCGTFHTLDSTTVKIKIENNKRKEDTAQSMHHLILTASEAQALIKLGQAMRPAAAPDAAQAAGAGS